MAQVAEKHVEIFQSGQVGARAFLWVGDFNLQIHHGPLNPLGGRKMITFCSNKVQLTKPVTPLQVQVSDHIPVGICQSQSPSGNLALQVSLSLSLCLSVSLSLCLSLSLCVCPLIFALVAMLCGFHAWKTFSTTT